MLDVRVVVVVAHVVGAKDGEGGLKKRLRITVSIYCIGCFVTTYDSLKDMINSNT